ncbi:transposase [Sulfitobacter sp. LCG007]
MPNYIRARAPGGSYFFTARLRDRGSDLLVREIGLLRRAVRETKARRPFEIDAIVVLPAAIHTIWTLPDGDADFSGRWSLLKGLVSRALPPAPDRSPSHLRRGEKGIWQRRFWEHLIRDARDLNDHLHLIHSAPVQAGLCARPEDWPWTSLHRDRREGGSAGTLPGSRGHGAGPGIRRAS